MGLLINIMTFKTRIKLIYIHVLEMTIRIQFYLKLFSHLYTAVSCQLWSEDAQQLDENCWIILSVIPYLTQNNSLCYTYYVYVHNYTNISL